MATITNTDVLLKLVMLGSSGAGKTGVFSRITRGTFEEGADATVGVEFGARNLRLPDSTKITVRLWDTAGQERFRAIASSFYRGASGALLLYDITNRASFEAAGRWLQELRRHTGTDAAVMLVGNKLDLEGDDGDAAAAGGGGGGGTRQVSVAEGLAFAETHDVAFIEASAKTCVGVEAAFLSIVEEMLRRYRSRLRRERRAAQWAPPPAAAEPPDATIVLDRPPSPRPGSVAARRREDGGLCCDH